MNIKITPSGKETSIVGQDGNVVIVNDDGQMHVVARGHVCTNNSTTTPLDASATFTGTASDILDYNAISIFVTSDVGGTLYVDYSADGSTNWRTAETYTIAAGAEKWFTPPAFGKYFRVRYVNDGDAQSTFELTTTLRKVPIKWSSHNINEAITDQDDAELVKSVLTAKNDNGNFVNIGATLSNNLKVTDVENGLSIAKGDVTGTSFIHKFGAAPDFDTVDNEVTVWDGADDAGGDIMSYTFSTTADIDSIVSSDAGDTQDIEVQGLDSNYVLVTQTITLTGQTRAALTTNLIRVFRLKNVGSTNIAGRVSCYVDSTISGGVPTDKTKVRAIIDNGNNQTLMAIYTIPAGKTGYMRDWFASTSGANRNASYIIKLKARPFGQVFQLKHISSLSDNASSYIQHKYEEPEIFSEKTDLIMTAQIANNAITAAGVAAGFDIVLINN